MKILILFFILIFNLFANDLKNHQSIILSSFSTYSNAQNFIKNYLEDIKKPVFIIKSKRDFFIVTIGIYTTKEDVYNAINKLPNEIKKFQPFRGNFNYDLTTSNAHILYTNLKKDAHIPLKEKSIIENTNPFIDSISLGIGKTNKQKDIQRLSAQKNFKEKIYLSDNLHLTGYFDFAFSRFNFDEKNIYSLSITPVFNYTFNHIKSFLPYVFVGIGTSYITNTKADDKNFSTNFQFEDRIGLGVKKDNLDFQLGYFHYSNASIKKPNDGIDLILLNAIYNY